MKTRIASVCLCLTATALAQVDPAAWPMPNHDMQRSGRNDFVLGPQNPVEMWIYDAKTYFTGTTQPTIDAAGNVYFGTGDYSLWPTLVSIDRFGKDRWDYPLIAPLGSGIFLTSNGLMHANTSGQFPQASYLFTTSGWRLWTLADQAPRDPILGTNDSLYWTVGEQGGAFFERKLDGSLVLRNYVFPVVTGPVGGYDGAIYIFRTGGPPQSQVSILKLLNGKETTMTTKITGVITYAIALPNGTFAAINRNAGYDLINIGADGTVKWRLALPGASDATKLHSYRDSSVVTVIGTTVTRWAATGNLVWQKLTNRSYVQDLCIDGRGTTFLLDVYGLTAYLLNGDLHWNYFVPYYQGTGMMGPAITNKGIVFGSTGTFVRALQVEGPASHAVRANVVFDGKVDAAPPQDIRVWLRDAGTTVTYALFTVTPNQGGSYDIPVRFGSTDMVIKPKNWLSGQVLGIEASTNVVNLTLRPGDWDNNNAVDLNDLTGVLIGFNTAAGDLNLDGTTGLLDLNLVLLNFGQVGEGL